MLPCRRQQNIGGVLRQRIGGDRQDDPRSRGSAQFLTTSSFITNNWSNRCGHIDCYGSEPTTLEVVGCSASVAIRVVQAVNDNDDDDYYHILVKKTVYILSLGDWR